MWTFSEWALSWMSKPCDSWRFTSTIRVSDVWCKVLRMRFDNVVRNCFESWKCFLERFWLNAVMSISTQSCLSSFLQPCPAYLCMYCCTYRIFLLAYHVLRLRKKKESAAAKPRPPATPQQSGECVLFWQPPGLYIWQYVVFGSVPFSRHMCI